MSRMSCILGIIFVLAIASLHISGFTHYTEQINGSNVSDFMKSMFPVLYIMPSLFLVVLAIFGFVAVFKPAARRPICLVLAAALLLTGSLALIMGEWIPVVIMGGGAALFIVSAQTVKSEQA